MQNRYAADIGDFVKLSMLRHLAPGFKLGVLWWLYPDEDHNADGKHVAYLDRPQLWRMKDPTLYDKLNLIVKSESRSVESLQGANLFEEVVYHSVKLPTAGDAAGRRVARLEWFKEAVSAVEGCNLLFLDPDNGLETKNYRSGSAKSGKSVALSELKVLQRPNRTIVVYHHHTRMAGGNIVELAYWGDRLADLGFRVDALRAGVGTARAFFLLDATPELQERAAFFAQHWGDKVTWHPALCSRKP
ncbi:hypothetical protein [Sphingobium xenophagum]|uniref:hypothetical protein n=1 Tax=Sphingobium xenophagum TaxID=121428 RepID=UPI00102FB5E7|nr:hypothetical protein [Sphingobium xenophagum]